MTSVILILIIILIALIIYLLLKQKLKKKTEYSPYLEAMSALVDNKTDLAIKKLKETVQIDTDNVDAYIRLGDLYRQKNDLNKAIQIHQTLTVRPTLTNEIEKRIYFSLAQDYLADKRFNRAISFLKEILKIDKENHDAKIMILKIYEETENHLDAVQIEEEVAKKSKDFSRLAYYYAEHGRRLLAENEKEGLVYMKKALKAVPNCPSALYYLGNYYSSQDKNDKAIEYWGKLLNASPNLAFLLLDKLEKAYYDQGRFDDIILLYKNLFNKYPGNLAIGLALTRIHIKKGELREAGDVLNKLIDIGIPSSIPQLKLAELSLEKEDYKGAKEKLEQVLNNILSPKLFCARCGTEYTGIKFFCKKCFAPTEIGLHYF